MNWPKRYTRKITVEGQKLLWHLSGNQIDCKETVITVGSEGQKYFLFIDPYPWDFKISPSSISKAVSWAFDQGWTPDSGPTRNMGYSTDDNKFVWLPDGVKYIHELKT